MIGFIEHWCSTPTRELAERRLDLTPGIEDSKVPIILGILEDAVSNTRESSRHLHF